MVTLENVDTFNELRKLLYVNTFYLTKGKLIAVHDVTNVRTHLAEVEGYGGYEGVIDLARVGTAGKDGGVDIVLLFRPPVGTGVKLEIPVSNTYHLPVARMVVQPIDETFHWANKRYVELGLIKSTFLPDLDVVELPDFDPQDPSFTLDTLERVTFLGKLYLTYYRKEGVAGIKPVDYFFV